MNMSTEVVITEDQLDAVKAAYVNAVVNNVTITNLVQIAGEALTAQFDGMTTAEVRDSIISRHNLETWNNLVEGITAEEK